MKIQKSKLISQLVNQKPLAFIVECVADLVIPGEGEVDDLRGSVAHAKGVEQGIRLSQLAFDRGASIYVAEQEVSGGVKDRIYFVGNERDIVDKLRLVSKG